MQYEKEKKTSKWGCHIQLTMSFINDLHSHCNPSPNPKPNPHPNPNPKPDPYPYLNCHQCLPL